MPKTNSPSTSKLNTALETLRRRFGHRRDVTGYDIGYKWTKGKQTDERCIRIHVQRKIPLSELEAADVFPAEIDGVPLDVIQGPYRVQRATASSEHMARSGYLMGGLSCGRVTGETGTIGAVVVDNQTGAPALLSNWHVLHGATGVSGDMILQPGRADGGHVPSDAVAQLGRAILDIDGDAAMAPLTGARPWLPLTFGSFTSPGKIRQSTLGETLVKSGRTTAQTKARVDGEGFYKLTYEVRPGRDEVREIKGFKLVTPKPGNPDNEELSSGGDSGALWTNPNSHDTVGLHFAGEISDDPSAEFAIACNMTSVVRRLDVRLATFDDLLDLRAGRESTGAAAAQNRLGLTPVPPGVGPQPPIGPWPMPPIGPWPTPPVGPLPGWPPLPTPNVPPFPPTWPYYGHGATTPPPAAGRYGVLGAETAALAKTQISLIQYIWPNLQAALIAKNGNFANAELRHNPADFAFTAGGGQIDQVIKDAVEESPVFSADGLVVPFRWFFDPGSFWVVCSRIGQLYDNSRYAIVT